MIDGADEHEKLHVYSVCAESTSNMAPVYTLEMCMTKKAALQLS